MAVDTRPQHVSESPLHIAATAEAAVGNVINGHGTMQVDTNSNSGLCNGGSKVLNGNSTSALRELKQSPCSCCGRPGHLRCGRCHAMTYCGSECQRAHWKSHKQQCTAIADAAAAGAAARRVAPAGGVSVADTGHHVVAVHGSNKPRPQRLVAPYQRLLTVFKPRPSGRRPPTGLLNTGNSCYASSTLQCLLATRPFGNYLRSKAHGANCCKPDPSAWCLACELQALALDAAEAAEVDPGSAVSPGNITRQVRRLCRTMVPGRQEDAHELFIRITEAMQGIQLADAGGKARFDARSQETTLTHHIFGGYMRNDTTCTVCGHVSQMYQSITDLQIDLGPRVNSVEDGLDELFAVEVLDGDNKYRCDVCKGLVRATKQWHLEVAPNVAVICLKRFSTSLYGKNGKRVAYPDSLSLEDYIPEDALDNCPAEYTLYAVLIHLDLNNSTASGHFVALVRTDDDRWWLCDDDEVQEIAKAKALSTSAYLLFYLRNSPRDASVLAPFPQPIVKQATPAATVVQAAATAAEMDAAPVAHAAIPAVETPTSPSDTGTAHSAASHSHSNGTSGCYELDRCDSGVSTAVDAETVDSTPLVNGSSNSGNTVDNADHMLNHDGHTAVSRSTSLTTDQKSAVVTDLADVAVDGSVFDSNVSPASVTTPGAEQADEAEAIADSSTPPPHPTPECPDTAAASKAESATVLSAQSAAHTDHDIPPNQRHAGSVGNGDSTGGAAAPSKRKRCKRPAVAPAGYTPAAEFGRAAAGTETHTHMATNGVSASDSTRPVQRNSVQGAGTQLSPAQLQPACSSIASSEVSASQQQQQQHSQEEAWHVCSSSCVSAYRLQHGASRHGSVDAVLTVRLRHPVENVEQIQLHACGSLLMLWCDRRDRDLGAAPTATSISTVAAAADAAGTETGRISPAAASISSSHMGGSCGEDVHWQLQLPGVVVDAGPAKVTSPSELDGCRTIKLYLMLAPVPSFNVAFAGDSNSATAHGGMALEAASSAGVKYQPVCTVFSTAGASMVEDEVVELASAGHAAGSKKKKKKKKQKRNQSKAAEVGSD